MKLKKQIPSAWLTIKVKPNKAFMRKYFSTKCKTYDAHCECCRGWRAFETTHEVEVIVDNAELCKALLKGVV